MKKIVIVNTNDITIGMLIYGGEHDIENNTVYGYNQNHDCSKQLFCYFGNKPRCFYGMDTYSITQIRKIVKEDEWKKGE